MQQRKIWWNEEDSSYYSKSLSGAVVAVSQIVYLNVNGGDGLRYYNEQLGIRLDNISVAASGFSETQTAELLAELNDNTSGIVYVSNLSDVLELQDYSTIYVGETDAFNQFGAIEAISETTGNAAKENDSDNAFVVLQNIASATELVSVVAHETGHLTGKLNHDDGGNGLTIDDFMSVSQVYTEHQEILYDETRSFDGDSFENIEEPDNVAGGAILNSGTLTVTGCMFLDNSAGDGAGIYNEGSLTINGGTFSGNSAKLYGGALFNSYDAEVINCTFAENSAGNGGALINEGTMTIDGCTFDGNSSHGDRDGAIYNHAGDLTIKDSCFLTLSDSINNNTGELTLSGTVSLAGPLYSDMPIQADGATLKFINTTALMGGLGVDGEVNNLGAIDFCGSAAVDFRGDQGTNTQDFSGTNISINLENPGVSKQWQYTVAYFDSQILDTVVFNGATATVNGRKFAANGHNYLIAYSTPSTELIVRSVDYLVDQQDPDNKFISLNAAFAAVVADNEPEAEIIIEGGDWSSDNLHQFGNGVGVTLKGGTIGSANYLFGGSDSVVSASGNVAAGNVKINGTGTMRGALGGGQLTVQTSGQTMTVEGGATSLSVNSTATGSYQRFAGGFLATAETAGAVTLAGDSSLQIDAANVSVTSYALGGSIVGGSASLTVEGSSDLNISAGSFSLVAGGGLLQNANATLRTGSTSILITGGTFTGNIYGGHLTTKYSYGANTTVAGNTSIVIDCTGTNTMDIGGHHIFGGSNGRGTVTGNSTITVKGSGSNLTFTGWVSGDSSGSGYVEGQSRPTKDVGGDRSLIFDEFSDNFDASGIINIDTLKFENGSRVVLADSVDLSNVDTWQFEYDGSGSSMLNWYGNNDFTDDEINLVFDSGIGSLSTSGWELMSGNCVNLYDAGSVSLFGETAELVNGVWTSDTYKLFVENDRLIAQLA